MTMLFALYAAFSAFMSPYDALIQAVAVWLTMSHTF